MRYKSIADVRERLGDRAAAQVEAHVARDVMAIRTARKFRNEPCEIDGERFDSKHEARIYNDLVSIHGRENVIRQISMPIGRQRIRPDFMVIFERFEDGSFRAKLMDAKGFVTKEWRAKSNHLHEKNGLVIETI